MTLVFPKDLIKAFFSSSSDLSVGQSLQAPSKAGLDLSSSSSQTTVANLDCKEARLQTTVANGSGGGLVPAEPEMKGKRAEEMCVLAGVPFLR